MRELERHIGMCARHHAKFRRMAGYARTERERDELLERADFWIKKQDALVTAFDVSKKFGGK